jgi:phenylalanyl-tRNA synthetase beta chain
VKAPLGWLREFAPVPADPAAVAARMAACGFEVAGIEGETIDFEITANRPDCLSVYGLAREAAVAFGVALAPAPADGSAGTAPAGAVPVTIDDAGGCGRYALALADVRIGPSPGWLADRIHAAGVRPINNLVDVTNYVMLELGHPLHAFDAARLAGPEIRVRRARAGESLVTLDGETRTLDGGLLVIADRDHAVALAGVMGGAASEVSQATSRVALESAWFEPALVRAASRRLGLKTEASARFERGADLRSPVRALARALALIEQIGAGRATGPIVDVFPRGATPRSVALRRDRIARLLGERVPDADVERMLAGLGFGLTPAADGWRVEVPSYRVDVQREADLIEDVGRHWGFDRIPATFPPLRTMPRPSSAGLETARRLRRVLTGSGLQEASTFTFIDADAARPFAPDEAALLPIANPLSEKFAVLRPSLLPGLLDAVVYNRRREQDAVRLFEIGATFSPQGERQRVAWLMTGPRISHWSAPGAPADIFDARGTADLVAAAFGLTLGAGPIDACPWFVPGRTAGLSVDGPDGAVLAGAIGQIRPELVAARGLGRADAVVGGELDLAVLTALAAPSDRRVTLLARFPSIVRDLSILVDERLPAAEVRGTIRTHAPGTLVSVREFDRYTGKGVPEGRVSLSLRLTFRAPERTLTDHEVQQAIDVIVSALGAAHGAELRSASGAVSTE